MVYYAVSEEGGLAKKYQESAFVVWAEGTR